MVVSFFFLAVLSMSRLLGYLDALLLMVQTHRFLSDNVKEVDAAREAGMQAFVVVREGNAVLSVEDRERNRVVESFEEIKIRGKEV